MKAALSIVLVLARVSLHLLRLILVVEDRMSLKREA